MPWVRIDDHFPDHPKVDQAGPLAGWLYVCALAYCNRNLTDGFVSDAAVPRLAAISGAKSQALKLVAVGLWDRVDGGYRVHDYFDFQKSREVILKERAQAQRRQSKFRNGARNAVTNAVTNGGVTPSPLPLHKPSTTEIPTSSLEAERDAPRMEPTESAATARRIRLSVLHGKSTDAPDEGVAS